MFLPTCYFTTQFLYGLSGGGAQDTIDESFDQDESHRLLQEREISEPGSEANA